MKKLLLTLFTITLFSCDDGDLQIETIDFDSITTINTCETIEITTSNVLFKINDTEALVLELPANLLVNEVSADAIQSIIGASGPSKLTYRTFSDAVSTNYFCSSIPLTTPTVSEEIVAANGIVKITTVSADNITYTHTITLDDVTFEKSDNSRITDLSISLFGTITTEIN